MLQELTIEQRKLANLMSSISEECYYAGWLQNLEYVLWDSIMNGERKYGHGFISQKQIDLLRMYAKDANSWIVFNDDKEETAIDLQTWEVIFKETISKNPELIKG